MDAMIQHTNGFRDLNGGDYEIRPAFRKPGQTAGAPRTTQAGVPADRSMRAPARPAS